MASGLTETSSVDDVVAWLNSNGFEDVSETFYDEGIDGEAMACLTEDALKSLVSRIGARMKLLKAIKAMNEGSNRSSLSSSVSSFQSDGSFESSGTISTFNSGQVFQVDDQDNTSGPHSSTQLRYVYRCRI